MKTNDVLKALAALAQGTRLEIYRLLVQQGPEGLPASAIAEKLGLPNATLSFHLKELSHAGLATARHDGRFIFYSAHYPTMNQLVGYLTENCCGGRECGDVCEPETNPERKSA